MNKWVVIPIITVLAIGVIASGGSCQSGGSELKDAQSEIADLEGDVSALEGNVSALEADLAASEAEVSILEGDLAAAEAQVATLEIELAAAEAEASISAELAAAEARVSALETELAAAEAQVSTLEIELAAAALGSTKMVYMLPEIILGSGFLPAIITVPVGTTVTWTNLTDFNHTATSFPLAFDSGLLAPGDSFSYTFTQPGVFTYFCLEEMCPYHDFRSGKVIVE